MGETEKENEMEVAEWDGGCGLSGGEEGGGTFKKTIPC